jgi:hypothetical protein
MSIFVGGSKYLHDKKIEYTNWGWFLLFSLFLGLILVWVDMAIVHFSFIPSLFCIAVLLSLFAVVKKYIDTSLPMAYRYRNGAHGEEVVKKILNELPDEYTVIADVRVPSTRNNVDFVVIGPTGIFVLEVKNVRGEVTVEEEKILENGRLLQHHDVLEQVRKEYWGVHGLLEKKIGNGFFVVPILVFANNKVHMHLPSKIREIHMVHCSDVVGFITSEKNTEIMNTELIIAALRSGC